MTIQVDILNYSESPEDEFIMVQYSGYYDDLPEHVKDVVTEEWCDEKLAGGDWITIVDGRVSISGNHHPFHIHWESDDVDTPLDQSHGKSLDDYDSLEERGGLIVAE